MATSGTFHLLTCQLRPDADMLVAVRASAVDGRGDGIPVRLASLWGRRCALGGADTATPVQPCSEPGDGDQHEDDACSRQPALAPLLTRNVRCARRGLVGLRFRGIQGMDTQ